MMRKLVLLMSLFAVSMSGHAQFPPEDVVITEDDGTDFLHDPSIAEFEQCVVLGNETEAVKTVFEGFLGCQFGVYSNGQPGTVVGSINCWPRKTVFRNITCRTDRYGRSRGFRKVVVKARDGKIKLHVREYNDTNGNEVADDFEARLRNTSDSYYICEKGLLNCLPDL